MNFLIFVLMFLLFVVSTLLKAKYHWLLMIENDTILKRYKSYNNFIQDPNYKDIAKKNYIMLVLFF